MGPTGRENGQFWGRFSRLFLCLGFVLSASLLPALEQGWAFRQIGEISQWPRAMERLGLVPTGTGRQFQGLMRMWLQDTFGAVRFRADIENWLSYESAGAGAKTGGASGWTERRDRLAHTYWNGCTFLSETEHRTIASAIDRFQFSWSAGRFDIDLGRQPISLGTSHFIGILDVLAPFHPGYLDASFKPGVDAMRVRTGMGTAGELEVIGAAEKPAGNNALLGRFRNSFSGFDTEVIGGQFRRRGFCGIGFDGERRKVNIWGEVGVFERLPELERHRGGPFRHRAVSWILGLERDLAPKFRLGGAFMHQDFGAGRPEDLWEIGQDAPFAQGWSHLTGREYGLLTLRREFTPLISGDLSGIFNMGDGSCLFQPKISLSTSDNSDIALFAWIGTGSAPGAGAVVPAGISLPVPRSEFGMFPDGIGVIARWFY